MTQQPNKAFWMPFTANRQFRQTPRMLVSAKDMYYQAEDGRDILDATAGLWCVNAGHGREEISQAVHEQIDKLDYAPTFQMGHPRAFEFADRLIKHSPEGLDHVFFTNSGSEAVESALKIALGYQKMRGKPNKARLIGREKGYHGTNFGGISVGGLVNNRRDFGNLLSQTDHMPHAWAPGSEFSKGQPENGAYHAEALNNIIQLHGDETIAAVIVEPVVGSGGVWIPPVGYLKRLREITHEHDILLIFDEVITGFGRVGDAFAATRFNVKPDIITTAKGLTNGTQAMGAVFVDEKIYEAYMQHPEEQIELFHGYTYSGHPVASAAGIASLDIYERDNLFQKAYTLENTFADKLHTLREFDIVKDIRNIGLVGAIELETFEKIGQRGYEVFTHCFNKGNTLVRVTGDTIAMSPPLIVEPHHIDQLIEALKGALQAIS